jgi:hypothetical protein
MNDLLERNLSSRRLRPLSRPFPHALADGFFRPAVYESLRDEFPCLAPAGGRADGDKSLYWGDEAYEKHLAENPSWRQVFHMIQSQAFVDFIVEQFGAHWERAGCKLDLARTRYVPYIEDRVDKERLTLRRLDHDPHELWCRLDFHGSEVDRYRPLHRDQRRRLISALVYFDDAAASAGLSGDLILHPDRLDLRLCHTLGIGQLPRPYSMMRDRLAASTRIHARANRMIAFLNSNRSWHSVAKAGQSRTPTRHVRIVVSSSVDIWA